MNIKVLVTQMAYTTTRVCSIILFMLFDGVLFNFVLFLFVYVIFLCILLSHFRGHEKSPRGYGFNQGSDEALANAEGRK